MRKISQLALMVALLGAAALGIRGAHAASHDVAFVIVESDHCFDGDLCLELEHPLGEFTLQATLYEDGTGTAVSLLVVLGERPLRVETDFTWFAERVGCDFEVEFTCAPDPNGTFGGGTPFIWLSSETVTFVHCRAVDLDPHTFLPVCIERGEPSLTVEDPGTYPSFTFLPAEQGHYQFDSAAFGGDEFCVFFGMRSCPPPGVSFQTTVVDLRE